MPIQTEEHETNFRRLRGRVARSRSIGTKLTPDEERQILAAAEAGGKAPSEWARDLLLRRVVASNQGEMEMHIFTELVGIQMLLMNTLEPLLRGEKLAQEQLAVLFRQVQTTKATQAQELLAKRSRNREKSPCPLFNNGDGKNRSCGRRKATYTRLEPPLFACTLTGVFVYIHFQYGLLPLPALLSSILFAE